MEMVRAECSSCSGTGLYSGMFERENEAVICLSCQGTGCREIHYKLYTGRRGKRGIVAVRHSRGSCIATGVGGAGESMTARKKTRLITKRRSSVDTVIFNEDIKEEQNLFCLDCRTRLASMAYTAPNCVCISISQEDLIDFSQGPERIKLVCCHCKTESTYHLCLLP